MLIENLDLRNDKEDSLPNNVLTAFFKADFKSYRELIQKKEKLEQEKKIISKKI